MSRLHGMQNRQNDRRKGAAVATAAGRCQQPWQIGTGPAEPELRMRWYCGVGMDPCDHGVRCRRLHTSNFECDCHHGWHCNVSVSIASLALDDSVSPSKSLCPPHGCVIHALQLRQVLFNLVHFCLFVFCVLSGGKTGHGHFVYSCFAIFCS